MRRPQLSQQWLEEAAGRAISELEERRATWQSWHLYAEAQRQVRDLDVPAEQVAEVVEDLVRAATTRLINLTADLDPIADPAVLRPSDGTSVYRHSGADHFTSQRMLDAERRIVDAAGRASAAPIDPLDVELALMKAELDGADLNKGQHQLVRTMVSDPREVTLALAPDGAGKTSAMGTLVDVYEDLGYTVIGLAPSAAAAAVLGEATGMPTETLAKLDHTLTTGRDPGVGPRTVIVIDEAGMADTPTPDRVIGACCDRGARVRLIGSTRSSLRSGPAGSCATSPARTAPYDSRRSSGSLTRSRPPRPSTCVPVTEPRWGSISTTTACTAETWPSNVFRVTVARAKVPKIRLHELRDHCAMICLQNGMSIYEVSEMLGHSSIKITEERYARYNSEFRRQRAARRAGYLGNLLSDPPEATSSTADNLAETA